MLVRTILGLVGIAGLAAGVWVLAYEGRNLKSRTTLRDQFYHWLLTLDSFMAAIGWAMWMGLFGIFISYSVTGQTII
jgi:hypothetical protein